MKEHYLVMGTETLAGVGVAEGLLNIGHSVVESQSHPRDGAKTHFIPCELNDPTSILSFVEELTAQEVVLDGVAFCRKRDVDTDPVTSPMDMSEHFQENIIGPLTMLVYLVEFGGIDPTASIVFLKHKKYDSTLGRATGEAIEPYTEVFKRFLPASFVFNYLSYDSVYFDESHQAILKKLTRA